MHVKTRDLIVASLFLLAWPGAIHADTLVYGDGREISGEVTKTETGYTVKTKGGTVKIPEGDVAKWRKQGPPAVPAPGEAASGTAPAAATDGAVAKASAAEAVARANQSIALGVSAYKANDVMAALENMLDAHQVLVANGVRIDPNIQSNYTLLNALGAGFIYAGQFPRANEFLDRAALSRFRDRSTVINHAILDYTQHVNVLRPVKDLTALMAGLDKDAPSHEFEVNLLGACLDYLKRDDRNYANKIFKDGGDLYTHLRYYLDKAHPRQVQWAGTWYAIDEGKPKRDRFLGQYQAWRSALASRDTAYKLMKDAEANFAHLKGRYLLNQGVSQLELAAAQSYLQAKTSDYDAVKDAPPKLLKEIEWPQWPPFPPVAPTFPRATSIDPGVQTTKYMVCRYAVAVPVAPDLLVTAASVARGATEFQLTGADGKTRTAKLVRDDADTGLALLRVTDGRLPYLKLAESSRGGDFACWGLPDVPVRRPVPTAIAAAAGTPKAIPSSIPWQISMRRHPRLPGAAVVDKANMLTAIALGERDALTALVPAVPVEQLRMFLAADLPAGAGPTAATVSDIFELRASH